jgi:release factor glutamine methyltransferase
VHRVVNPSDALLALQRAGVRVVRLDAAGAADDVEGDLLVPRAQRRLAAEALERADWRFEVGNRGLWRFTRHASYGWDDGLAVHLHWGLPAAPLPSRALARLERLLWERSQSGAAGTRSLDPAVQLAVASVQIARPHARRARWRDVAAEAASRVEDWDDVARVADEAGVAGSVRRTLARLGTATPPSGRDSLADRAWIVSSRLRKRIPTRRTQALLAGEPLLGRSVRRCRFAGIEVLAGPGVFRPMTVTEHMVEPALAAIPAGAPAPVLEVGTGCGAVALAIAVERRDAAIHASDVSPAAIRWARRNQRALGTRVSFRRGSLLEPFSSSLERQAAVVAGNVPYIPAAQAQPATQDTPGAILGEGDDGLGLVRRLSSDARRFLRPGGLLVLQMMESQWATLASELATIGYRPGGVVGQRGPHVVVTATLGSP